MVPQSGNRELSPETTNQQPDNCATRDQEDAKAIARGISAWKILSSEGPRETQEAVQIGWGGQWSPTPKDTRSSQGHGGLSGDTDESNPNQISEGRSRCPFATLSDLRPPGHEAFTGAHGSTTKRPDSLPTPPELREGFITGPLGSNHRNQTISSPPPSTTASASKCPIRYLDERSPEEIARYFETHKHDIPRSHEVCVKRYQSNEESIRQLDAKYGSLVSMIQGLGVKHKPLLPTKEDDESVAMEHRSLEKVEKWADNVKSIPDNVSTRSVGLHNEDDREGHFDRPLDEVRVGESPSRPWGIRVPIEKEIAYSASLSSGHRSKPNRTAENSLKMEEQGIVEETAAVSNKAQAPYPSSPISEALKSPPPISKTDQPRMLFTGPVFIGYPAEQAAELMKQCGTGVGVSGA